MTRTVRGLLIAISTVATIGAPALAVNASLPHAARPVAYVAETGRVLGGVDGDTIHARVRGRDESIRFLAIDTPERGRCWAGTASTMTLRLAVADRGRVRLYRDARQGDRDRYGRLLRFVHAAGRDIGRTLVARGLARVYVEYPTGRTRTYLRSQRAARRAHKGIWSGHCGK